MPTFIQSFEDATWCVNNVSREIQAGQVVAFDHDWEAVHFVKLQRAGLIGDFTTEEQAQAELARLIAENESLRKAAADAEAATGPDNQGSADVTDRETKAVTAADMEVSAPAEQPAVEQPKAHANHAKKKGK